MKTKKELKQDFDEVAFMQLSNEAFAKEWLSEEDEKAFEHLQKYNKTPHHNPLPQGGENGLNGRFRQELLGVSPLPLRERVRVRGSLAEL